MNIHDLAKLERNLTSNDTEMVLLGLESIQTELSISISNILVELTYHYDSKVRASAYVALFHVRNIDLTKVIRDGLSDLDREVLLKASELFHRDELAA